MDKLYTPNITSLNPKLWIVDYFDDLINKLDIITEKIIYKCKITKTLKDKLNSKRAKFINEIKRVESYNLDEYEKNIEHYSSRLSQLDVKNLSKSQDLIIELKKELFKKFCVFIEALDLPRNTNYLPGVLIITDWYITDEEVEILK